MGDHRMTIKIEAEFHGVKRQHDSYLNYYASCNCRCPDSIIQFFDELYDAGMDVYDAETARYREEATRVQREAAERAELARLKEKYETT